MATEEKLRDALRRAHRAGDTRAAERFAARIKAGDFDAPAQPITTRDVGRSFAQGATLGWGDELQGKLFSGMQGYAGADSLPGIASAIPHVHAYRMLKGLLSNDGYEEARDAERRDLSRFRKEHPIAAGASEIAGGVVGGLAGGAALPAGMAKSAASLSLPARAAVASATGAGGGAVAGAGSAETVADIPAEAGEGAVMGALVGPAVEGLASGAQAIKRAFSPQRAAERSVRRAIRRGDESLDEIRSRLDEFGPDAVLADVNEGLRQQLDSIVNTPGTARTRALKQLEERSRGQVNEILSATGPGNYFDNLDDIIAMKRDIASPVYQRAFRDGVPHTEKLEGIFTQINDTYPSMWRDAKRVGKLDSFNAGRPMTEAGLEAANGRPSLLGWQSVKERMDDKIGELIRAGRNKEAGKLTDLKRTLLAELDSHNSDYATARGMWAGLRSFETAMDDGTNFLMPKMSSAKLENHLSKLNDSEKFAYREGARQAIQDKLEKAGYTHDASKFFNSPAMRKKMTLIFGDDAPGILSKIDASSAKQRTFAEVSGNSRTALRTAAQAEEGAMKELAEMGMEAYALGPASPTMINRLARSVPTSRESTRNIAADMLLEDDPEKLRQIVEWLQRGKPMPTTGAGLIAPAYASGLGLLAAE